MATLVEHSIIRDQIVEPEAAPMDDSNVTDGASTDSMVTVRLSEPVSDSNPINEDETIVEATDSVQPFPTTIVRPSSEEILHAFTWKVNGESPIVFFDEQDSPVTESEIAEQETTKAGDEESTRSSNNSLSRPRSHSRSRSRSSTSDEHDSVDWVELERTEESEQRDETTDESTAFLLARLEQENQALATDPRFMKARERKMSRPPSMHVLKKLVSEPSARKERYSLLPNPPPMTELEFWAALVKDYPQTAQRLPTLTSNKIKAGIPPPLRGVVWMSMVGARDRVLCDEYDKLSRENSPYEVLISKDIGRSFPGVEMFRDPNGEGQQMLARVLKAFSLYDKEIGYCQGLGFIVGPLLMQMNDRDAFCVLVRLMEKYDLRSCYLPSLAGLHLRIFQFQRLLTEHLPTLAAHLSKLQVEAAYLSQWFLSFFAVTCPLEMLFRIYDVIFAEGASETIMRVALSLMRRNEDTIMASSEFEDVMQLLLSRSLWNTYSDNADELVNDFTEMTGVVTRESLQSLEVAFKEANPSASNAWFAFLPDATAAASHFLGRIWNAAPARGGLSPTPTPSLLSRPGSFLRRTPSKQSIAVSINSTDMSSEGTNSLTTAPSESTQTSTDSAMDIRSVSSKQGSISIAVPSLVTPSKNDKELHGQIEDLLMALNDMQQQQALLDGQLQKEREERCEDHRVFEDLINRLQSNLQLESPIERRQTLQYPVPSPAATSRPNISDTLQPAKERLDVYRALRRSVMLETKQRLRDSLMRSRDQLHQEQERSTSLSYRLDEQERETASVREQLREAQMRLQEEQREKQRMEKQIQEYRTSSRASSIWSDTSDRPSTLWRSDTGDSRASITSLFSSGHASMPLSPTESAIAGRPGKGGLRELKLGRRESQQPTSAIPARSTSLATQTILSKADHVPANEDEMLLELVAAKTSEAEARQELEEIRAKFDAMRRMLGMASPSPTSELAAPLPPPAPASSGTIAGWFGHRPSPSETTIVGNTTETKSAVQTPIPPKIATSNSSASVSTDSSAKGTPTSTPPAVSVSGIGAAIWGWGMGKRSASAAVAEVSATSAGR